MAEIDPTDKTIVSYTVRHHKFDPETNHFRWFDLNTFDSEAEMDQLMTQMFEEIEGRRLIGKASAKEQVAGRINELGTRMEHQGWSPYQSQD